MNILQNNNKTSSNLENNTNNSKLLTVNDRYMNILLISIRNTYSICFIISDML